MSRLLIIFIVILPFDLFSQVDTLKNTVSEKHSLGKALIIPSAIIVSGFISKQTTIDRSVQEKVQSSKWRTQTNIDDYLRFAPMVELYLADYSYSKSRSEVFQQTKNLFIAQLLSSLMVETLKRTTNITRPDGGEHSFPSGHSSIAFTGATALYLDFKDQNKLLAYSGYGFSTATGVLRITSNKHWLSDVLVGAGIGIASAQLAWHINPLKNWDPFKKKKIAVYPYVDGIDARAGLCIVF